MTIGDQSRLGLERTKSVERLFEGRQLRQACPHECQWRHLPDRVMRIVGTRRPLFCIVSVASRPFVPGMCKGQRPHHVMLGPMAASYASVLRTAASVSSLVPAALTRRQFMRPGST